MAFWAGVGKALMFGYQVHSEIKQKKAEKKAQTAQEQAEQRLSSLIRMGLPPNEAQFYAASSQTYSAYMNYREAQFAQGVEAQASRASASGAGLEEKLSQNITDVLKAGEDAVKAFKSQGARNYDWGVQGSVSVYNNSGEFAGVVVLDGKNNIVEVVDVSKDKRHNFNLASDAAYAHFMNQFGVYAQGRMQSYADATSASRQGVGVPPAINTQTARDPERIGGCAKGSLAYGFVKTLRDTAKKMGFVGQR